jgi:hypothetical protein
MQLFLKNDSEFTSLNYTSAIKKKEPKKQLRNVFSSEPHNSENKALLLIWNIAYKALVQLFKK